MEPEGSLPHSQVPATCSYPEPASSSPCSHISLPGDPSNWFYITSVLFYSSALLSQIWSMYLLRNKWDGVIKERESAWQRTLTWSNYASSEPTEQIRHIKYLAKIEENFHHSLHFITWGVWGENGRVFRRCFEGWKVFVEEWVASDGNYFQGHSMLMK